MNRVTEAERSAIGQLLERRLCLARARHHRLALVLAGQEAWTVQMAEACLAARTGEALWLSDRPGLIPPHQPLAAGLRLLGLELDFLVYDALGGFDPDSFGAASGALRRGGLLLLLTPPLADWPWLPDPQAGRIAVEPFTAAGISGHYLARLARTLRQDPNLLLIEQGQELPRLDALPPQTPDWLEEEAPALDTLALSRDQAAAIEAIIHCARGRARRPLVIVSDRGRGKTSALGLAAGLLLLAGISPILVTAPRRAALDPFFHHAARPLANAAVHADHIALGQALIRFLPPDVLSQDHQVPSKLLLVDEAAALPAPLLERLLIAYPRLVFATTIHGYEGTGRGFEVRFSQTLRHLTPEYRRIELKTPIRWAPDDPVEGLVARALLLDASPAADEDLAAANPGNCHHARLDPERLAGDERLLSPLFGLLVLAHYQTSPLDLRHLLDGPNIQVHCLDHGGQIAATALVATEGGLAADLIPAIYEGRRRPRGHLLPQTLSAHAGLEEAPRLGWSRILRIAVHPAAQGRGLGRSLVTQIQNQALREGRDLLGVSFGATQGLLRFWRACGLVPVHLGTSRNAASGTHAAVVVKALSPAGERLALQARERFGPRFATLLAGPFQDLEPDLCATLLALSAPEQPLAGPAADWRELEAFARSQRPFEPSLFSLLTLTRHYLGPALRSGHYSPALARPLIARVLQYRDWAQVARMLGVSGRAEVIARLREACAALLEVMDKSHREQAECSSMVRPPSPHPSPAGGEGARASRVCANEGEGASAACATEASSGGGEV